MIHFAEKPSCCQSGPDLQRLSHRQLVACRGSVAVVCVLSLWSEVARKPDTQLEPAFGWNSKFQAGVPIPELFLLP